MLTFNDLTKNLKKDFSNHRKIRIAILGDSATQLLVKAIKGYGFELGINFDIYEADYDQIERQIFDADSDLYIFKPEFVIILNSTQKLINKFYKVSKLEKLKFADNKIETISNIYRAVTDKLSCKVIYFNYIEINDSIFGNYANKTNISFIYQIRKLNYELMNLSQSCKNLYINDLGAIHNIFGSNFAIDSKMFINSDIVFSIDFIPFVTKNLCDIILSIIGHFHKCVILDLDNTLWGGVIGDDGIENIQIGNLGIGKAFSEFQLWIKQLKERGIILAVCSKNYEQIAKGPFEKHPEMVLKLDDIAVFVANWDNKADNIKNIQSILNISFDSIVFLDDNPFERNIVKTHIPEITVPELPEDPAEYLSYLRTLNLFETASFTDEDELRTQQYKEEAQRIIVQKTFINEDDFLLSLDMESIVKPFDNFSIPRVAQLTQRSNQFNLRTIRYSEEEIKSVAESNDYFTLSFTLEDKFGDNGLISMIILKKHNSSLFIDTWIMSCRVLKRSMENFVLNQIVNYALELGYNELIGEYIPTAKNSMVKEHYQKLGFKRLDIDKELFYLDLGNYTELKTFIKIK